MVELCMFHDISAILKDSFLKGMVEDICQESQDPWQPAQGEQKYQYKDVGSGIDWFEVQDPVLKYSFLNKF